MEDIQVVHPSHMKLIRESAVNSEWFEATRTPVHRDLYLLEQALCCIAKLWKSVFKSGRITACVLQQNRPRRACRAACWEDNAEGCQSMLYKLQRKSPEFSSNPKQSVHDCAAGIEIDFF